MKIALLGAPGTGKTQLAHDLSRHLPSLGYPLNAITDAPPLMAAICAGLRYDDPTLADLALAEHQIYDLTLVCGLDLPCPTGRQAPADAISRDAVDARLRAALTRGRIAYAVVYGQGPARVEAALNAIASLRGDRIKPRTNRLPQWQASCEKCSDPECEHRMFTGQLNIGKR